MQKFFFEPAQARDCHRRPLGRGAVLQDAAD